MKEVYTDVADLFEDRNVVLGILKRMKCHIPQNYEEDILQAVALSLVQRKTFERFDPNKGVKQLTFLHICIKNAFLTSRYGLKNQHDPYCFERVGLFEADLEQDICENDSTYDLEKYLEGLNEKEVALIKGMLIGETSRNVSKGLEFSGSRGGQLTALALEKIKKKHFTKYSVYSLD